MTDVVYLTHLDGTAFVLNAEYIETVEGRPDTVITTIEGKHFVVREGVEDVVERVIHYRRSILGAPSRLVASVPGMGKADA